MISGVNRGITSTVQLFKDDKGYVVTGENFEEAFAILSSESIAN